MQRTDGEKIALAGLVVAVLATGAAWLVVPEFREWIGLDRPEARDQPRGVSTSKLADAPNAQVPTPEGGESGAVAQGKGTSNPSVAREGVARAHQYEEAAMAGNAAAMHELGLLYEGGVGVPQNYERARQWYEKSAASGDAAAMDSLGGLYALGKGVVRDFKQAREWFERGAAGGDAQAMNNLAYIFDKGFGLAAPDPEQARQWYEKAAAAGNTAAMCNLGAMYVEREKPDYHLGRRWFEQGAAAGDGTCMRALGIVYERGEGVTANDAQARGWYERAASAGDKYAAERLKTLPK
jgi:TPR repeat protein